VFSVTSYQNELRRHFPTIYLTLISILVALAIEGLLERMYELPSLYLLSSSSVLAWLQISIVLSIAALFWWVIARWASTLPWVFGFFDALAPLVLLVVLHILADSVGTNADRWFGALGAVAIGGSINYAVSARRALALSAQADARSSVLFPAAIPAGVGIVAIVGTAIGLGALGTGSQILLNTAVIGVLVVFSVAEFRFRKRTVTEHLERSPAATGSTDSGRSTCSSCTWSSGGAVGRSAT
jgi:hypothetical protein